MYTLIAENQYQEQLELTHSALYDIKSILGLDPPDAVINTTRNAGQDGSVYNSAYMDNRTITITLAINHPAEINRINLYRYFKIKSPVILRYKNGSRSVWILGYCQSFQVGYFEKKETAQIVILCPKPWFNDVFGFDSTLSNVLNLFEFPFSIEENNPIEFSRIEYGSEQSIMNYGDVDIGMVMRMSATGTVVDPQIYNVQTGAYIKLSTTMQEGDVIDICTIPGSKYIRRIREGVITSMVGKLTEGSSWISLRPGNNIFALFAQTNPEYLSVLITATYQYEGV